MLEIYHPPHVAREEAARKMLWRVLLSLQHLPLDDPVFLSAYKGF